jgi:hypothetical protein
MKKNAEIPKLRIDSELYEKLKKALELINKEGLGFTMAQLRRTCYSYFTSHLISGDIELKIVKNY